MSHFFKDVGDIFSAPVRATVGFLDGNPKYNSIGDIYDQTIGPENPIASVANDEGLHKLAGLVSAPSWDALGKPGQAFSDQLDKNNSILPADWRPYAEPVEAAALSLFNPFAGAALNTAYQGGQEQAQNKGFDWGQLGENAAINFGTAGVGAFAKDALAGAQAAQGAGTTLNAFNGGASSALQSTVDAAKASTQGALSAFSTPSAIAGSSLSTIPYAQGLQSSGKGIADAAYKGGLESAQPLASEVLNSTLAPQQATPITGALDSFGQTGINTAGGQGQYGDVLNAFGGGEVNTANPNGPRIDDDAFNNSVNRLASNDYLQQGAVKDTSLPAGQYQAQQNTPYANQLNDISKGTTQAYADLLDQTNNANSYYSIIDSNPGITSDQLNAYLNNPSSGVLGNFTLSPDDVAHLQNIRPLGPMNSSLL